MDLLQRKLYFSKDPEEVQHFPGSPTFFLGGGVQMLISIETHITCDIPGGPEPLSPLWICTWCWYMYIPGNWYCISRERGYLVLYLFNPGSGYLISTGTSQV